MSSPGASEFSAEEQDQGRVIDPDQNQHEGGGGAVSVLVLMAQVQAQEKFAEDEQDRSQAAT